MDVKSMQKLEEQIGKLHLKKIQGKIDEEGVVTGIANLLKHENRRDIAALIYLKSLPHGTHTAVMKQFDTDDLTFAFAGLLYNMTWILDANSQGWKFTLSKDPFTNIMELDPSDPRYFFIENTKVGVSSVDEALATIDGCFDVVLPILEDMWRKENQK